MEIKVANCKDKRLENLSRNALKYFTKELITNTRIRNNCSVTLDYTKDVREEGLYDGDCGIVSCNTRKKPRKFFIRVYPYARVNDLHYLGVIAHETVHMKQFAYDELDDDLTRWKSRKVNIERVRYEDCPWEIEANRLQDELVVAFLNSLNE